MFSIDVRTQKISEGLGAPRGFEPGGRSQRGTNDRLCLRQHQQAGRRRRSHQGLRHVDAAKKWFEENDPEGVAFEYEVLE